MRRKLKFIAIRQQRKQGKRNLVKTLRIIKRELKNAAKQGKLSMTLRRLDVNYEWFIILRYLRIHSDLKFEFYGSDTPDHIDSCKISWD